MNFNIIITTVDLSTRLTSPMNRIGADRLCRTIEAAGIASARMVAAPKVIPPESRIVTHSHGSTVYCISLSSMDIFILEQVFGLVSDTDKCFPIRVQDCSVTVHDRSADVRRAVRTHRRVSNIVTAELNHRVRPFVCDSMHRYN